MLLNSDGVLIKNISRSLWITTIAINEVPRKIRFQLPNMIVAMISYGSQKPKRSEFTQLLDRLANQLTELEKGIDVYLPQEYNIRDSYSHSATRISVYLTGVICDKPAQAIVQNITDSGGFYGCSRCQISGSN